MENNVITLESRALAAFYEADVEEIWQKENFENTGTSKQPRRYSSLPDSQRRWLVMFSPGCGLEIDAEIARRVRGGKTKGAPLQLAD
jgi:hypothetical protein